MTTTSAVPAGRGPLIRMFRTSDGAPALCATTAGAHPLTGVAVHPLAPGRTGPLLEVFAGMSPQSRWMRFLSPLPQLRDDMLRLLTDVDHDRHGCWYAVVGGCAVGVGRYIRDRDAPEVAEVALEVVDRYQGRGVGGLLLAVVAAAAADVGVGTLSATMDAGNVRVRRLAAPFGGRWSVEQGVLEGQAPVPWLPELEAARVACCAGAVRSRARELRVA